MTFPYNIGVNRCVGNLMTKIILILKFVYLSVKNISVKDFDLISQ